MCPLNMAFELFGYQYQFQKIPLDTTKNADIIIGKYPRLGQIWYHVIY